MSETEQALIEASRRAHLLAVTPITVLTREAGVAWARLAPGHRPILEARWFREVRAGVLAPQIVRLERLAREAAADAGLSLRSETTTAPRAYAELHDALADEIALGDDLARRRIGLAAAGLAHGVPLHLDPVIDIQDAAAVLTELGLLALPNSSLAAMNATAAHPIRREPFDSAVGRLAATITAWHGLIAPAAARYEQTIRSLPFLAQ